MNKYKPSLIPDGEIAVDDFDDAVTIAKILMKNGNVVMLSQEENLTVINFIWTDNSCNRNDVVLMDRCDFEMCYREIVDEDEEEERLPAQRSSTQPL